MRTDVEDESIRSLVVIIGACFGLASCGTAMDLLDLAQPRTETFLRMTAEGVGPLDAGTAASADVIAKLMPGYSTGTVLIGLESETANAIVLFTAGAGGTTGPAANSAGGDIQVLDIVGGQDGKIREIHGVSQHVTGPGGEKPGMTLAQTGTDVATCRPGTGLWSGMAVCLSSAADNVRLLFSLRGDAATHGRLPPGPLLETGELQRIIWTPKKS